MKSYQLPPALRTLIQILVPDIQQAIVSLVTASVIYLAGSARYYWELITGDDVGTTKEYSADLFTHLFGRLNDIPHASTIILIAIWGAVGLFAYLLVIFIINSFISAENNAELNNQLENKPRTLFINQHRRFLWFLLFLIVLALTIFVLLPLWLESFSIFNNLGHEPQMFALAIAGLAYNLYLLFACIVAVRRNPRLNG